MYRKLFFLSVSVGLLAGCSSVEERDVSYYVAAANKYLFDATGASVGEAKIYCAEAEITREDADFTLEKRRFTGTIDELRLRAAGAGDEIRRQAMDPDAPEHINALKSAALLHLYFSRSDRRKLWDIYIIGRGGKDYALWALAQNGDKEAQEKLWRYLEAAANGAMAQALAYPHNGPVPLSDSIRITELEVAISAAGNGEDLTSECRNYLTKIADDYRGTPAGAQAILALARHGAVEGEKISNDLEYFRVHGADSEIISYYIRALGEIGTAKDIITLGWYLDGDERIAVDASGAIIKINQRLPKYGVRYE